MASITGEKDHCEPDRLCPETRRQAEDERRFEGDAMADGDVDLSQRRRADALSDKNAVCHIVEAGSKHSAIIPYYPFSLVSPGTDSREQRFYSG